jgi:hypothetical protein
MYLVLHLFISVSVCLLHKVKATCDEISKLIYCFIRGYVDINKQNVYLPCIQTDNMYEYRIEQYVNVNVRIFEFLCHFTATINTKQQTETTRELLYIEYISAGNNATLHLD